MSTEYFGNLEFQVWEFALLPFYFIIIFLISSRIKNVNIRKRPEYKYYLWGLYAKILGGLAVGLVYLYYYRGGDTTAYFQSGVAFANLFFKDTVDFFIVYFTPASYENLFLFDSSTGWPLRYLYEDRQTFMIIRLISPFIILTFKSYLLSTIMVAWISYFGIWRVYLLFCNYFKGMSYQLAIAFLFIPSVVFWGSGLLKDTFTFSAVCWFVYAAHNVFFARHKVIWNILYLIISLWVMIAIKPYIFMVLLPSVTMWLFIDRIRRLRNQLVVFLMIPLIYLVSIGGGFAVFTALGSVLEEYSLDNILGKAIATQHDLKQDYYHGSSFDIGEFDASFGSIISKTPAAVTAGLFRPFLWDVKNPMMALSAIENTLILLLTLWVILKLRIRKVIRYIFKNPVILFSLSFAILFAFSVGLTTSNLGALVRFKIPLLPFFVASLLIMLHLYKQERLLKAYKLFKYRSQMEKERLQKIGIDKGQIESR